jgi:hypothetical protein
MLPYIRIYIGVNGRPDIWHGLVRICAHKMLTVAGCRSIEICHRCLAPVVVVVNAGKFCTGIKAAAKVANDAIKGTAKIKGPSWVFEAFGITGARSKTATNTLAELTNFISEVYLEKGIHPLPYSTGVLVKRCCRINRHREHLCDNSHGLIP